ncbi:hypothetical protein [Streptomyces goshikiensis]|uniref:hypothetical protein n=1 Tax=Streptomyces goshikiensis TaxID=1942 RepID=UPI0033A2B956
MAEEVDGVSLEAEPYVGANGGSDADGVVHNSNGLCGTAALENGDWQHILDCHRPGGALTDDEAGIFISKEKKDRQRIADTINRGTPKPNTQGRPGQIYEWGK